MNMMESIFKNILEIIGAITVIFVFINLLLKIVPEVKSLQRRLLFYFAKKWKHKKLEKLAIASDIENAVNRIVFNLQKELPSGWISEASIEWVEEDVKDKDLEEEEIILRIRPVESQNINFLNGVYFFFRKALFPGTKEVIPINIRRSTALHISRRVIETQKPFLTKKFESHILESTIKEEPNIVYFIDNFSVLDRKGFFTGTFLREIHEIANRARFKELRNQMDDEIKSVLQHIKKFIQNLHKDLPDVFWSRKGPATSYAFLLVSQPFVSSISPYLKRVRQHLSQGVERIYIMGTNQERHFVRKVISAVAKIPECKLIEIFELNRDYRGDKEGIGALFIKQVISKEEEIQIESFFDEQHKKL